MSLYDAIAGLELQIDGVELERREVSVTTGFQRVTTTVVLEGAGARGSGEDVIYSAEQHDDYPQLRERGRKTLDELSAELEAYGFEDYRRWAFESAALDLALVQNGTSLGGALGLEYRAVRFVVSTRAEVKPWLALYPELELKLDPTSDWSTELMHELASTGRVRVLDLKGQYHGTAVDQPPDPVLYGAVVETFPDVIVEDPALTPETRAVLAAAKERLSWDAPIHSVADIERLEWEPRHLNIKPSRFGSVRNLLDAIDYCRARGIAMYGGGQFELGPGRGHVQRLASLFYAEAPNDVAPGVYNEGGPRPGLPQSPLPVVVPNGL